MPQVLANPASGLVAIILITRSRPGPKLVFHYPAVPILPGPRGSTSGNAEDDSDLDSDSADEESNAGRHRSNDRTTAGTDPFNEAYRDAIGAGNTAGSSISVDSNGLLGYSAESLEKLLSPGRWSDRKKFEVCLDDLTFVGHPMYANVDGEWSSKKQDDALPLPIRSRNGSNEEKAQAERSANITITSSDTPSTVEYDYSHVPESLDSQKGMSLATSFESASTASGAPAEQLAMFHVVFVLSGIIQHDAIDIHDHVAKKLSKALHYCQKQSSYVSQESRKLLAAKARAKQAGSSTETLWADMVEGSELAWALKELYEKLSQGQIAGIRLSGMELSLQLPGAKSTASESKPLDGQSGLLLIEDKDVLLRELSHLEASPLAYFVSEHNPTKNLQKHARNLNMSLNEILYLANHLIKWRKARPITPLHLRNTYVVAPDAPIDKVTEIAPLYARRFAALPTLPQMLKVLSGRPIRYGVLIPSRDHRAPYMEILAFLHRYGFVAPLRTYGWLRARRRGGEPSGTSDSEEKRARRPISGGVSLLSPHLRPVDDDSISVDSGQTVVTAIPADDQAAPQHDTTPEWVLIKHPEDPSGDEEAKALRSVRSAIVDSELRERLPQLLQYFDGEHAFEEIAGREGLKRAKVEDWLDTMERQGLLLTFRAL